MTAVPECPHCGATRAAFTAMSEAVLAIAGELSVDHVLRKLVDAARRLAGARYAAIGVPDGEGGFARFITSGMSEAQWDALGELPRTHGLLGAMLETAEPYRTTDISQDPRFEGWPKEHPNMRAFLGVPIVARGAVIGAFYLTNKRGARRAAFTEADESLITTLAAHAAIAIESARLYERSRELTIVEERNRLARELHDSVTQTLFSVALTAEAATLLADTDVARAKEQIRTVQELARDAMEQMRSLVFELRAGELGSDGLGETLRKHVEVLRRVHGIEIALELEDGRPLGPSVEKQVFRVAQEALANALRHGEPRSVRVDLRAADGRLTLVVADDGCGFDPSARAVGRHLGLVSMRERAEDLGGTLTLESCPGGGTTVRLEVTADDARSRR